MKLTVTLLFFDDELDETLSELARNVLVSREALLNRPLDCADSHPTVVECPGEQKRSNEEHSDVGQENAGMVLQHKLLF